MRGLIFRGLLAGAQDLPVDRLYYCAFLNNWGLFGKGARRDGRVDTEPGIVACAR